MDYEHNWALPPPSYADATAESGGSDAKYSGDIKEDTQETISTTSIPQVSGYSTYTVEFAKNSFHMDYLVKDATDKPLYYVDNKALMSTFRGGKPDVIVHEGGDTSGPIIFVSHSNIIGNRHEMCFGDPATSDRRAELKLKNWVSLTTEWSPPGTEKLYRFERVCGKDAKALGGRTTSLLNLKLTDVETGEMMATYLNDGFKTWRKAGTYQIKPNPAVGEEWDKFVICVCGVLTEKERRSRRWASSSSGGGQ